MANVTNLTVKKILPFIIITIVLGITGGVFFYFKYYQKPVVGQSTEKERDDLITKVGKLIELPTKEKPTLATVSDPSQLASQPFFARTAVGDKVLIYLQAKKAILYRPSTNKIINVGPINTNQSEPQQASAQNVPTGGAKQKKAVKIALYNGTTTSGLTSRFINDLTKKIPDVTFEVVARENANTSDYKKTKIIDLTGTNQNVLVSLVKTFKAISDKLPSTEAQPGGADILVILGSDYGGGSITPTVAPTSAETPAP